MSQSKSPRGQVSNACPRRTPLLAPPTSRRRPVSFASLITPTSIPQQWTQAVDAERVPQAVLLTGAEGSELLPLALKLVGYLQCTNRQHDGPTPESCNACEACRGHAKLVHPDVHFTFPVVGTGNTSADHIAKWREAVLDDPYLSQRTWLRAQTTDNKQGNINRDEVMRILHDVSLQRFTDGHKVVLIWGADYLGDESNRLLKVIEEPPARTLVLLVTSRFERILPTIASRCRVLRVPPPPIERVVTALQERGVGREAAQRIAYAAGGNIGQALAAGRDFLSGDAPERPDLAAWLRACFAGRGAGLVKASTQLAALTREQQKHFLERALRFVRELGVVCAGSPQPLRLDEADRAVATKLAALLGWPQLTALAAELESLMRAVERNANGKIAFTASAIRIHHILAS